MLLPLQEIEALSQLIDEKWFNNSAFGSEKALV